MSYEILKNVAVLTEEPEARWVLELNVVKWFDKSPVLDLRRWSSDHSRMQKGLTLSLKELHTLKKSLDEKRLGKELLGINID